MKEYCVPEQKNYFHAGENRAVPVYGSVPEEARFYGISRYLLRKIIEDGKVPALRIGSADRFAYRVDHEALGAFLRQEASRGQAER